MRGLRICLVLLGSVSLSAFAGQDNTSLVNTQKPDGKVFRGATLPFGMLMWGPSPMGYSLNYLSGASMPEEYDNQIPILPVARPIRGTLFSRGDGHPKRPKSSDSGEPGYYRSNLANGTGLELTATTRTGHARLHFPSTRTASVLFYLYNSASFAEIVSPTELQGSTIRGGVRFYFFARFNRPFYAHGSWKGHNLDSMPARAIGQNGVYVTFDAQTNREVELKVGISFTKPENARLNLDTENALWDFDSLRSQAHERWTQVLSRIEIKGGKDEERATFFTNFYHMFLGPSVHSDVNGEYLGFDDQVHRTSKHVQYANFSGWDIYRSWVQLMAWLYPHELSDMMQSLVNDALEAKGGMPRWPVANHETGVMDPGSATPIVANAYAFGARDFDVETAFDILDRSELDASLHCQKDYLVHEGLDDYLKLGYVAMSTENDWRKQAASLTLEYALGDFALSRLALALGKSSKADQYQRLSQNWKTLYDPEMGLIVPRTASGEWWDFFEPHLGQRNGFTEGNSFQYTWMVPHNLRELIARMGGDKIAVKRLDRFFRKLNTGQRSRYAWMGNEPSFDIPWIYNWAHAPWKAQEVVRRTLNEVFMRGLPGDDDLGETSSWSIWAMLGLYPTIPGLSGLAVGSPLFPEARLALGDGRTLSIHAPTAAAGHPYIQSLLVGGRRWSQSWLKLSDLGAGPDLRLEYELGPKPDKSWAASRGDEPPSFDTP